ncbi:MAG: HipA N-terminal domain-containing protein [Elusimicrobiota bacterium]
MRDLEQGKTSLPKSFTELPLRAENYESKALFLFFNGLLPEGWQRIDG